jgi:hypothetical protein
LSRFIMTAAAAPLRAPPHRIDLRKHPEGLELQLP